MVALRPPAFSFSPSARVGQSAGGKVLMATRRAPWRHALLMAALAALLDGCALPTLPWQRQAAKPLPDAQQVAQVAMAPIDTTIDMFDPLRGLHTGATQVIP